MNNRSRIQVQTWFRSMVICLVMGMAVWVNGCNSLLTPFLPEPGGDNTETSPPAEIPDSVVTVVFSNLSTTDAVDVQFFTVEARLLDAMNELFVEENAVSRTLGVAGTGILGPGDEDFLELPCTEELTLGTAGGIFFDNDTGDTTGTGSARWVQEQGIGLCNSVVTFRYIANGQMFATNITIERP